MSNETNKGSKGVCPYCAVVFDSFEELKRHVISEHKSEPLPLPPDVITLIVNGQTHELKVQPEWTLYQVIHDRLGLTGVKMFLPAETPTYEVHVVASAAGAVRTTSGLAPHLVRLSPAAMNTRPMYRKTISDMLLNRLTRRTTRKQSST